MPSMIVQWCCRAPVVTDSRRIEIAQPLLMGTPLTPVIQHAGKRGRTQPHRQTPPEATGHRRNMRPREGEKKRTSPAAVCHYVVKMSTSKTSQIRMRPRDSSSDMTILISAVFMISVSWVVLLASASNLIPCGKPSESFESVLARKTQPLAELDACHDHR